ncbi:hypothetical protein BYT27DRAFT_7206003 [Phlegmacium glaucopus]|nr:hypothetical protein BYT27DRAFT_7206003 [Phlegmacium glaucopus]
MAEAVCGVLTTVCLDICAGICLDFASTRHGCTEYLCSCTCCRCMGQKDALERQPLIDATETRRPQPESHPVMQVPINR